MNATERIIAHLHEHREATMAGLVQTFHDIDPQKVYRGMAKLERLEYVRRSGKAPGGERYARRIVFTLTGAEIDPALLQDGRKPIVKVQRPKRLREPAEIPGIVRRLVIDPEMPLTRENVVTIARNWFDVVFFGERGMAL